MLAVGGSYGVSAGRKGARWRRMRAQCLALGAANGTPCYGCQEPIDYAWTGSPRHPRAPTVHHIQELWLGGDPYDPANHTPCHFGCNSRISNQLRRVVYTTRHEAVYTCAAALADPITSRNW